MTESTSELVTRARGHVIACDDMIHQENFTSGDGLVFREAFRELADALEAQDARIEALEANNQWLTNNGVDKARAWDAVAAKNERIAQLRETLERVKAHIVASDNVNAPPHCAVIWEIIKPALDATPAVESPAQESATPSAIDESAMLQTLAVIICDSHGVAGWHLNGDVASWGELFDSDALAFLETLYGKHAQRDESAPAEIERLDRTEESGEPGDG